MSEWMEVDPENSPASERRCDLRHRVSTRGELAGRPLVLSNLSRNGFRALHPAGEVGVGQVCRARLQLGEQPFEARVRLVWSRTFGSQEDGGFAFLGLTGEQAARLQTYLEGLTLH